MQQTLESLIQWLPDQRWFTSTPSAPRVRVLSDLKLPSDDPAAQVHVLVVVDESPVRPIVYQIPIVEREMALAGASSSTIGVGGSGRALIDGPHDPAYTRALLASLGLPTEGVRAHVLAGEQSNTSVIFDWPDRPPVICKVFRQLGSGLNPDIELQTALDGAGSAHVPRVIGRVEGGWSSPADADTFVEGSFAFAQEFLPGVEDAWRVARHAAAAHIDFTADAEALGRVTADVHRDLARLLPTAPADADARAGIAGAWARRLAIATDEVPALAALRPAISAVYAAAAAAEWPALQRVHGDYHLGQVLSAPERGWVVLDFEGEPMRPIAERRAPDLALRDIAGMLRSFDYVAGSLRLDLPEDASATEQWAADARHAFLTGYRTAAGIEPTGALLDALELDKAVYEAIYEARHRPTWVGIPLSAIDRLVAG